MRIESISLDLCIGNKASLVGVGQDHFFHRLKFLELIVDQTPIPACFNDGFAWPFQTGKKLRKPSCAIAFDSSLAQLPPALIQRAQHAVLLVDIYSDVVHENSFLSSSSLRTGMLLSCYLSLILLLAHHKPIMMHADFDVGCWTLGVRRLLLILQPNHASLSCGGRVAGDLPT